MAPNKEKPYQPSYTGFDVEETRRAQETYDRAEGLQAGKGEAADDYLEAGPAEAAERLGESESRVSQAVERAGAKSASKSPPRAE